MYVFSTDDADLLQAPDGKPHFNDNVGIASSEDVERDRGLYKFVIIVRCPKKLSHFLLNMFQVNTQYQYVISTGFLLMLNVFVLFTCC